MNRSELKLNAKNVLKKNYSSAILFCFVYHTVTGRLGAEISFILTILFYRPSDPDLNIEKIGFSENVISEDILYYISIAASVLLLAVFAVFFVGPLSVAKANFFIKARKDSFKASYAFNIFREGRYEQVLKIMLARNIILFAGYLLIIPGIYLSYTFRFVPYIAAENPDIGWKEALKKSKGMTDGHKFELFVLNLSFAGWYILSCIVPIFGKFIVKPYNEAAIAEAYEALKNE
ncbi:MAG: DUF975 family protein [Clostridia bacterium]|nr:DUF975 family protein [Clostridia bacterium]